MTFKITLKQIPKIFKTQENKTPFKLQAWSRPNTPHILGQAALTFKIKAQEQSPPGATTKTEVMGWNSGQ
jgi:hypothetical protein